MTSSRFFNFVARHPRTILAIALLCSLFSIIYTVKKMEFLTGRDDLMPRNAPFQVDYRAYRAEFGDQEEIVCVIESGDADLTSRAADALYAALSRENGVFRQLFYPGGLPYFRSNGLLFMPLQDLQKLRSTLTMAAPVLRDLAATPTIQTLFSSLTSQIDRYLAAPDPENLKSLAFMLATLNTGFKGFDGKTSALSLDSFLKGGGDGKPSMLEQAGKQQVITVLPVKEAGSFVPAEKAINTTRAALAALCAKPEFKNVAFGLTGVPVLEYEEMNSSQSDMELATILSLTLTVALLFYAFRGLLNVIAAMVSLLVGISLAFGFATFAVGHLNILSMVFAIMLIGLGIEYGIQVVLRYQEELALGATDQQAVEIGITHNVRSIIWAAATTAMAFITFTFTDFKGISELGIIAAGGIVLCVITTFTVLPAMLILLRRFRKPVTTTAASAHLPASSRMVLMFKRPQLIMAATLLLVALCLYPALQTRFDYNLMNLQAKGLQSVEYAYKLMRSKENSGYFAVVTARDLVEARSLTERLEKLPAVDHVVSLMSLVPDQQEQKRAELAAMRDLMSSINPQPYQEDLRVMELPTVFEHFRASVEKLKTRLEAQKVPEAQSVGVFLTTLDSFFASLEKEKDRNALGMLREFQGGMFADMPAKLKLLKDSLNVSPSVTLENVPAELKQRFVGAHGTLLLQVAAKNEIFDRDPLQEFVGQVKSIVPHATGEPVMVYESLTVLRDSYTAAFGYAFIGIAVILLLTFRSIPYALIGILPMLAGLVLMVGAMELSGIRFNSANIIVLPLILGVGIDSAIYIINRYRQGGETAVQVIVSSAGKGVFLNALTILFSFGALMVAHHQGVFSIGAVMSLGMIASVASFLLFLPAILMLWKKK